MVVKAQQEELQCGHGGQAVVDIVEGALINVQLTLPACTAAIEGQIVKIDPRAVFLFQLEPLGIAFKMCIRDRVWLGGRNPDGSYFGDHYKWRVMRSNGVPEEYITGDKPEDVYKRQVQGRGV